MPWTLAWNFSSYTIASQTSQLTGYEAGKLPIIDEHPYLRSWRSNNQLTTQTIRCTFASAVSLAGIGVFNLNGPFFQLSKSTNNGSTFTDVLTGSSTLTNFTAQKHWAYYRKFLPVSLAGVTDVRLIVLAQTPVDGAAYLEVGSLVFASALTTIKPPRLGMRETPVREYDQSGRAKRAAGPWRLEQDWNFVWREDLVPTLRTLAMIGEDTPFLVAESTGQTEKVGLYTYDGAIPFERNYKRENVSIKVKELA